MQNPRFKIQNVLRCAATLTLAALTSPFIGCTSSPTPPPTTSNQYAGPLLSLEPTLRHHQVTASTPSSGWALTFDRSELNDGRHDIFVTLRRPNPLFSYTSDPTIQRALTNVEASIPVDVYARTCDFDAEEPGPYSLAIPHQALAPTGR